MPRSKKINQTEQDQTQSPRVYGWVAGLPAHLQEHPDNQKKKEGNN